MGYYEGWDNVWRSDVQVMGWLCPRCGEFVPIYQEHSCEAVEPEQKIQISEAWREEGSQQMGAP